jgi:predicted RNA-binding protein with PUA-like domain
MNFWLIKSEPSTWSWAEQVQKKTTSWDGVRNYQAAKNLKAMRIGDLAFFYHSNIDKKIMGIVRITKEYYPDPTDETRRFGMVDVEHVVALSNPISLATIKENQKLNHLPLVYQSRLSVMPIDKEAWNLICEEGGVPPQKLMAKNN